MSRTALICDDATFMRKVIERMLVAGGFTIVGEASTGPEALRQYEALKPDLVTMDVVMPEMGGIETARSITSRDPDACIVMCSAMGQDALMAEALKAGASAFVVKPFDQPKLLAAAEEALARRAARAPQ